MKFLQSSIFRALTAIAVGVLLIKYPDNTVTGIVIAIGILFLLSGIVSVLAYLNARKNASEYTIYDAQGRQIAGQAPMFPIVGIGSILLGAILAVMPATFINALMYVIGVVLILGAINQYMATLAARRFGIVSLWYWVWPTLTLLVGAYVMIKPMAPLSTAMLILGWLSLFYGITEAVSSMLIAVGRRRWEKEQEELAKTLEAETVAKEMKDDDTETAADTTGTETKTGTDMPVPANEQV